MDPTQVLDRILLQITNGGAECEIYLVGGDSKHRLSTRPLGPLLEQITTAREQFSPEVQEIVLSPRSMMEHASPRSGGWRNRITFKRSKSDKKRGRKNRQSLDEGEMPAWFTRATAEKALHLLSSLELLEQPTRLARDLALVREKAKTAEPYAKASLETSEMTFEREFANAMLVANCAGYHSDEMGPVRSFAAEFGADRLRSACEAFETECNAALHKLPPKATKQVEAPPESWPANQIPVLEPGSFDNPEEASDQIDTDPPSEAEKSPEEASGVKPLTSSINTEAESSAQELEVPQPTPDLKKPETLSGFLIKPDPHDDARNKMRMSWARILGIGAENEKEEKCADAVEDVSAVRLEKEEGSTAVGHAGGEVNSSENEKDDKLGGTEGADRNVPAQSETSVPEVHAQDTSKSPLDAIQGGSFGNAAPMHSGIVEGQSLESESSRNETAVESRTDDGASGALPAPIRSFSLPTFKGEPEPSDAPPAWSDEPEMKLARDSYGSGQLAGLMLSPVHSLAALETGVLASQYPGLGQSPLASPHLKAPPVHSLPAAGTSNAVVSQMQPVETSQAAHTDDKFREGEKVKEQAQASPAAIRAAPVHSLPVTGTTGAVPPQMQPVETSEVADLNRETGSSGKSGEQAQVEGPLSLVAAERNIGDAGGKTAGLSSGAVLGAPENDQVAKATKAPLSSGPSSGPIEEVTEARSDVSEAGSSAKVVDKQKASEARSAASREGDASEKTEAKADQIGDEVPAGTHDISTTPSPPPEGLPPLVVPTPLVQRIPSPRRSRSPRVASPKARSYEKQWQNHPRSPSPKRQAPDVSRSRRDSMASYKERREAKMREQEERIRTEHEAKLKAMEDALEKRKAEMAERSRRSALLAVSAAERKSALEALNASTDSTEAKERALERLQRPDNQRDDKFTPPAGNRVNLLLARIVSMVGNTPKPEVPPSGEKSAPSSAPPTARSPSASKARASQRILDLANPRSQSAPRKRNSEAERKAPQAAPLKQDDWSRSMSPGRATTVRSLQGLARNHTPVRTPDSNTKADRLSPGRASVATTPCSNASPFPSPRGPLSGRYSPERSKPKSVLGGQSTPPAVKRAASVPAKRGADQKSFAKLGPAPSNNFASPSRGRGDGSSSVVSTRYPPSMKSSSGKALQRETPDKAEKEEAASVLRPKRSASPSIPTRSRSTDPSKPRWSSGLRVTVADSPSLANGRSGNRTATPGPHQNQRSTSTGGSRVRSSTPATTRSMSTFSQKQAAPLAQKDARPPRSRQSTAETPNPNSAQKWISSFRSTSTPRAPSTLESSLKAPTRIASHGMAARERLLSQTKASQAKLADRAVELHKTEDGPQLRNRREWKSFVGPVQVYASENVRPVRRSQSDVRAENRMSESAVEKTVQSVQPRTNMHEQFERQDPGERQERESGDSLRQQGRVDSVEQLFGEEIVLENRQQKRREDIDSQVANSEHAAKNLSSPEESNGSCNAVTPVPKSRKRWEDSPADPLVLQKSPSGKKGVLAKLGRLFSRRSSKGSVDMSSSSK